MSDSFILLASPGDGGRARPTMNRPGKRNALSIALRDQMSDALDALPMKAKILRRAGIQPGATLDI